MLPHVMLSFFGVKYTVARGVNVRGGGGVGWWFTPPKALASRSKNAYNRSQNKYYAIEGLQALPSEDRQHILRPTVMGLMASTK